MSRGTLAWMSLGLVAATVAVGCRMCASPYDDCRPTFTGQCGEDCAPMARAGSILSGYFPPVSGDQFPPDQVPDLPDVPSLPGEATSSPGVTLSPTEGQPAGDIDLVIDAGLEATPPKKSPVVEDARPLSFDGWTAVRRTE
jgi:hypothetical protein